MDNQGTNPKNPWDHPKKIFLKRIVQQFVLLCANKIFVLEIVELTWLQKNSTEFLCSAIFLLI